MYGCLDSCAAVMVFLAVADAIHITRSILHVESDVCPYTRKKTLKLGTAKGPRPTTSQYVKEITKAGDVGHVMSGASLPPSLTRQLFPTAALPPPPPAP